MQQNRRQRALYSTKRAKVVTPAFGEQGDLRDEPRQTADRSGRGWIIGALAAAGTVAAGAAVGTLMAGRATRRRHAAKAPAAFNSAAAAPGSFDHTRDAGAANIRDLRGERGWDKVDQSADESFPASDPPATY